MKGIGEDDTSLNMNGPQHSIGINLDTNQIKISQLVAGSVDQNGVGDIIKAESIIPTPEHKLKCIEHKDEKGDNVESVYEKGARRSGSIEEAKRLSSGANTSSEGATVRSFSVKFVENESDSPHINLVAGNKGNNPILGQTLTNIDLGSSTNLGEDDVQSIDSFAEVLNET